MNVAANEASKDDCVSDDAIYKLPILLHSWDKQGPLQDDGIVRLLCCGGTP